MPVNQHLELCSQHRQLCIWCSGKARAGDTDFRVSSKKELTGERRKEPQTGDGHSNILLMGRWNRRGKKTKTKMKTMMQKEEGEEEEEEEKEEKKEGEEEGEEECSRKKTETSKNQEKMTTSIKR